METIEATYRIVTPMFIGGADPNTRAELRPPSIKAALRFWYRTIDSDYKWNEARIFGGAGKDEGQAMFLLALDHAIIGMEAWQKDHYESLNVDHPDKPKGTRSNDKSWTLNGNTYLGFSLKMGDNKRKAIPAGESFTLRLLFKTRPGEEDRKRILAAIWLLGHLGGLGSRSRRGFGTIALQSWQMTEGDKWPEMDALITTHGEHTPENWQAKFQAGLGTLKDWFGNGMAPDHTVLGNGASFYLFADGQSAVNRQSHDKNNRPKNYNYQAWEMAMDVAGKAMQGFRQRWKLKDATKDYLRVKAHLCAKNSLTVIGVRPNFLSGTAPERAAFGLPLTFRYGSLAYQKTDRNGTRRTRNGGQPDMATPQITFQGTEHDRSASPLWIHIVEIDGKCHPFFALLKAPLLDGSERVADQRDVIKARRSGGAVAHSYTSPGDTVLHTFCKLALKPSALEVRW